MKPIYRAIVIALSLGLAGITGVAVAAPDDGKNPITRGSRDPFHSGPLYGTPRSGGTPDLGALGRPPTSRSAQVNPVPEPSQWAMMVAGLALVGFIVRRNRKK